jgi:polyisoprenoid-binding protein YceI
MKKINSIVLLFFVFGIFSASAQTKYFSRNGNISFYSSAPLEEIEARNTSANSVMDVSTGQIEFAVLMKAFGFQKALMEEHFNENYIESSKYPKSTFKGKIENISQVDFSKDGKYMVTVSGQLTIHGVTKDVSTPGVIEIANGEVNASSEFKILIEDYKIEIPNLVKDKVAREVKITVNIPYQKLTKSL